MLIDGAAYFEAVADAISRAKHSVFILGWDMNSQLRLRRKRRSRAFADFLSSLVAKEPGLKVYLLNWDYAFLYALEREFLPTLRFQWTTDSRIQFKLDKRHPFAASHHQKIVVVDDSVGFCGGLDLTTNRWDTPEHKPDDPRRKDPDGKKYGPIHDVQMMVEGEAASILGELARERWWNATKEKVEPSPYNDVWPAKRQPDFENIEIAIARTIPLYHDEPEVREVERLYRDAIRAAKRYIYFENQYVTSAIVADALFERVCEKNCPEIILVDHSEYSGMVESRTMGVLRSRLMKKLKQADKYGKIRFYHPVLERGKCLVNVHSKLMIVDDFFLRVGSSNLSNRSMGLDTECDLALESRGDTQIEKTIRGYRNGLLAEHLGTSPEEVEKFYKRTGSLIQAVEELRGGDRTLQKIDDHQKSTWDKFLPASAVIDPDRPLTRRVIVSAFLKDSRLQTVVLISGTMILIMIVGLALLF